MSEAQNELVVLSRSGINGKTVASTVIDTTENGTRRFVPLYVLLVNELATSITVGPTVSFGTNSATYNNIVTGTAISGAQTTNNINDFQTSVSLNVAANTDIRINITTGATGTTLTVRADVVGYYA